MAAQRIEDMTIGEISDRVSKTNEREDVEREKQDALVVREITGAVLTLITRQAAVGTPSHPFRPHWKGYCVSCCYAKDHPVHEAA